MKVTGMRTKENLERSSKVVVPRDVSDDGIARFVCPKCSEIIYEWKPSKCTNCNINFRYLD